MELLLFVGIDNLSAFATDTAGELDVLGHDGDTLGVDGAQVGVFEETDQVSFAGLLQHKTYWVKWASVLGKF